MKKKKLWSSVPVWVASFLFIASWAVLGVTLALKTSNVGLNGNVTFTATNVYALVTGSVEGTQTTNTLNDIEINADTQEKELGWNNVAFDFKNEITPIVVTINIQNRSTERALIVGVSDSINTQNLTVTRKIKTSTSTSLSEVSAFGTTTIPAEGAETLELTLHIKDTNKSVDTALALLINLTDLTSSSEEDITYSVVDGKAQISAYTGSSETFVIPSTINGCPTTLKSGGQATAGLALPATTKTVIIPSAIKSIPQFAFSKNSTLENVVMEAVESIGYGAFANSAIKSVSISSSLTTLGNYAFNGCTSLTNVSFPSSVETIGLGTFMLCSALENIVIPDSVKTIGMAAFGACTGLKNISLPNSLKTVGQQAFQQCTALENIDIPDSVESIGEAAFVYCSALKSVNLSSSLKTIYPAAFQACSSLKNIDIPDSVEFIGDYAFNHCSGMENTTIKIPNNIKQIGGTEYIQLDSSNTSLDTQAEVDEARRAIMGTHVFYDCATDYLTAFSIDSSNENYMVVDGVLYTKNSSGDPEVLVAYPSKKVQPNNTYTMPDTVKDSYELAMSRTYNLEKIILSDAFVIKTTTEKSSGYCHNGDWANNLHAMMYHYTSATIEVKSTNTRYYSENGAIYGKDGTDYANTLFYMPSYATTSGQTFTIKTGTTTIQEGAIPKMEGVTSISKLDGTIYRYTKIYIPASVTTIGTKSINTLNSDYTIEIDSSNTAYTVTDGKIVKK